MRIEERAIECDTVEHDIDEPLPGDHFRLPRISLVDPPLDVSFGQTTKTCMFGVTLKRNYSPKMAVISDGVHFIRN